MIPSLVVSFDHDHRIRNDLRFKLAVGRRLNVQCHVSFPTINFGQRRLSVLLITTRSMPDKLLVVAHSLNSEEKIIIQKHNNCMDFP